MCDGFLFTNIAVVEYQDMEKCPVFQTAFCDFYLIQETEAYTADKRVNEKNPLLRKLIKIV